MTKQKTALLFQDCTLATLKQSVPLLNLLIEQWD